MKRKQELLRPGAIISLALGAAMWAGAASADQVFLDDVIVDGSLCVGFDCVNGESFGFDTIRIKENNLRIKAQDTSSTASFPTQDWQITFNDTSNGGANKFSIDAIAPVANTPFTIEAGSGNTNALYIDDGGRIGFGTSTPVVDLHVKSGNTPTLRLEQDGSSGFAPQTWDVAGNEANFFIRDATNGSTLPFRIYPGAPTSALIIEATTGDIGIGTTSPEAQLHVFDNAGSGGENMLVLENNGNPELLFENTNVSRVWEMSAGSNFLIRDADGGTNLFSLSNTGTLTLTGGLVTGTPAGTCNPGPCDLVFDPSVYTVPSIEDHAKIMWEKMHLPAVGPTRVGEPINVPIKLTRMLNELEKAHIYIEQLHKRIEKLEVATQ